MVIYFRYICHKKTIMTETKKKRPISDKDRKVSLTLSITLDTAKKARKRFKTLGKAVEFAINSAGE